jgi:hypothetical protein
VSAETTVWETPTPIACVRQPLRSATGCGCCARRWERGGALLLSVERGGGVVFVS